MTNRKHRPRALLFRVTDGVLYAANHGRRFDRPGVISVCRENLSPKTERGPSETLDQVPDRGLVAAIREKALTVYAIDRNRLQEDANHEDETRRDYAGRSLWELLQNADDALASSGTSSADLIGAKGLGFKSVLELTDTPSVHSGPFDLGFDAAISRPLLERIQPDPPALTFRLPHVVARDAQVTSLIAQGYATVVRLPLRSRRVVEELVRRLVTLDPHFLLLCRNLDTVDIECAGHDAIRLWVDRKRGARLRNSPATLSRTRGDETSSTEWRIWSSLKPAPEDGTKSLSAAIAVPVAAGAPHPSAAEIPIHVFFPTAETIGSHFLVHGSFALTSNRNSIRADQNDELVRDELALLVRQVLADVPASSAVRLFADVVRSAAGSRARRPDRLIQQAIANAVASSRFIPLLGGGHCLPAEVRTWEHGLDAITPASLATERRLAAAELQAVAAELRGIYGAQPLRPADYAELLSRMRALTLDGSLQSLRIAYAGCLAHTVQPAILEQLASSQTWPTTEGAFRALSGGRFLLDLPDGWPEWLPADVLHGDARPILEQGDASRWGALTSGRLLRKADDWIRGALAPSLEAWTDEDWRRHGFEALALIERWAAVSEFGDCLPFVERPGDISIRQLLAKVARVPTAKGWVPSAGSYAGRELGGPPELAAAMKEVPDRHVVGMPSRALAEFGQKRWRALLRWLGVSWEPKVRLVEKDGWLGAQPSWLPFRQALKENVLHVNQEWFIEHFPGCVADLGPSQLANCIQSLARATEGLNGLWRKNSWADRTHPPAPFRSYADFQLRTERYLPPRMVAGRRGDRLAPHELFWPERGIPGITPILDLGTQNRIRRAGLRPVFVDRLQVNAALPTDWNTWRAWSDALVQRVRAGDIPPPKGIRDFYDALLRTFRRAEGPRITEVVGLALGRDPDTLVEEAARTLWIDQGRFEAPEVLQGLGQLGRAILPVRLERGAGAVEVLGVRAASAVLQVAATHEEAPERRTTEIERRLAARRGALAAICASKGQRLRTLPRVRAVTDLRLSISVEGHPLADRTAPAYLEGSTWLINLQSADRWEAVAAALAEPFGGHAPDLKYRFARILGARRDEVRGILADDGIPDYRIREALLELEEGEPAEADDAAEDDRESQARGSHPADGTDHDEDADDVAEDDEPDEGEDTSDDRDEAEAGRDQGHGRDGEGRASSARRDGAGRLRRRRLFGGGSGVRDGSRRADGQPDAAQVGLAAEAWLANRIAERLGDGWTCFQNVRDDSSRETDLLLVRGGSEWHIEVKCLGSERLYWSELEREKAERNPGRYHMALLVGLEQGGYAVHWSWDPLADLEPCARRLEWLWEGSAEGPSLRNGWMPEAGLRWPRRAASRYTHVIQVTQRDLDVLDRDDGQLEVLLARLSASSVHAGGQSPDPI